MKLLIYYNISDLIFAESQRIVTLTKSKYYLLLTVTGLCVIAVIAGIIIYIVKVSLLFIVPNFKLKKSIK